ncbi:MCE family protein [Mycolicibacterium helvum]|uniref:Mce family protein Mce3B n=1 Tax=Mycolicibacterium helvum TaxID=1534349 RepID=A0A7I7T7I9_9MYCO|nr:MCE family protein [Mycolicibacterium helvum]BBY64970.1 Mce family protein Mce3B [Mycolicibacterium helvum]
MRYDLGGVLWRLGAFLLACGVGAFVLVVVFAQLRFTEDRSYRAEFTNVSGLKVGDFVRIAGVEVGKVRNISIDAANHAIVEFAVDDSVPLTEGTRALVRYENLIGGRSVQLEEGPGGTRALRVGEMIPRERTQPALDLDALIGGFRPLFRALDPEAMNALTGQLIQAFQGQGETISSFLSYTATLTSTIADRDRLIGEVVGNLNVVLGSLGEHTDDFDSSIDSLSQVVARLYQHKTAISDAVAATNAAAVTVADLLGQSRPDIKNVVGQSDRLASTILADADGVDDLLRTLPDTYRALNRMALYGDYFSFYLCDAILKLNGKGGQPVYVKVAGQDTGRCAAR